MLRLLFFSLLMMGGLPTQAQAIFEVQQAEVSFFSNAPKELIEAVSKSLAGVLDVQRKTFAFKIGISSFKGFNSPLQREHFNENYLETVFYPEASFVGKIIEDDDLLREGSYTVRTKGKLKIHGIEQERIIRSTIKSERGVLHIHAEFSVLLADYNIKIPMVVNNKLSPEIKVSVQITMVARK